MKFKILTLPINLVEYRKMVIHNHSRYWILRALENGNIDFSRFNLISINTAHSKWQNEISEMREAVGEKNFDNVLFLKFDDVVYEDTKELNKSFIDSGKQQLTYFSENDAEKVIEFIKITYDLGKDLMVHCTAGISRSSAISIFANEFVNKYLTDNYDDFHWNETNGFENPPMPNSDVAYILRRVFREKFV